MVVVVVIGLLAVLASAAIKRVQERSLASRMANDFKQVAAAFQNATPLVAVLLGFLIFRELKGRDGRVTAWSVVMVLLYAAGVALICLGPAFVSQAA